MFIVLNPNLTKVHRTRALNLCLNLCSRKSVNWTHKRASSRTPSISWIPKCGFLDGLTRSTSSCLNTDIVGEFLIVSSNRFHSSKILLDENNFSSLGIGFC